MFDFVSSLMLPFSSTTPVPNVLFYIGIFFWSYIWVAISIRTICNLPFILRLNIPKALLYILAPIWTVVVLTIINGTIFFTFNTYEHVIIIVLAIVLYNVTSIYYYRKYEHNVFIGKQPAYLYGYVLPLFVLQFIISNVSFSGFGVFNCMSNTMDEISLFHLRRKLPKWLIKVVNGMYQVSCNNHYRDEDTRNNVYTEHRIKEHVTIGRYDNPDDYKVAMDSISNQLDSN